MNNDNKIKLFLVDDDALFLKSLEIDFSNNGDFEIETFISGELCIANLSKNPDIIILDYHLDGINPEAFERASWRGFGVSTVLEKVQCKAILI